MYYVFYYTYSWQTWSTDNRIAWQRSVTAPPAGETEHNRQWRGRTKNKTMISYHESLTYRCDLGAVVGNRKRLQMIDRCPDFMCNNPENINALFVPETRMCVLEAFKPSEWRWIFANPVGGLEAGVWPATQPVKTRTGDEFVLFESDLRKVK